MPIEIREIDGGVGIVIEYTGNISAEELQLVLKAHLEQDQETFRKIRYSLADWTRAESVDLGGPTARIIADMCIAAATRNPEILVAVVATEDLYFGLARIWASIVEGSGWEGQVFRDRAEAVAWMEERARLRFGIESTSLE